MALDEHERRQNERKFGNWEDFPWAQDVMQEGDFNDADYEILGDIVSRIGVADIRAFGLTGDDCEQFLRQLGYTMWVDIVAQR